MNIAVIDDEINISLIKSPVTSFYVLDGRIQPSDGKFSNNVSHGTICTKIIETYGEIDNIYFFSVLHNNGNGSLNDLTAALEYCLELNIGIINLSSGIINYFIFSDGYNNLLDVCMKLKSKGITIIAAQSNRREITIPADFPYVYGVEYISVGKNFARSSDFYLLRAIKIYLDGRKIQLDRSNSYSCAFISAFFSHRNKPGLLSFFKGNIIVFNRHALSENLLLYPVKVNNKLLENYIELMRKTFWPNYHLNFPSVYPRKIRYGLAGEIDFTRPVIAIYGTPGLQIALTAELYNTFIKDGYIPQIMWPQEIHKLVNRNETLSKPDIYFVLDEKKSDVADIIVTIRGNNIFAVNEQKFCDTNSLYEYIVNYFAGLTT